MVGVAGKSKGCATCRRRKVGCDLGKPSCQRCLSSGKECEGYEKYPIFVIRTAKGLEKRRRLEEVKLNIAKPQHLPRRQSYVGPVQTRNVQPDIAARIYFVAWFWEAYTPVSLSGFVGRRRPGWLQHFITRNSLPALDHALLAISLTTFGRTTGTISVYQEGRRMYSRALQVLQMSLQNQDLLFSDEILAAVYLLMTYELRESTSGNRAAWHAHVSGVGRLLQIRGPQRHDSLLGRRMYEDFRYVLMLQAVLKREASPFGLPEWRLAADGDYVARLIQDVYDVGFDLAAVTQLIDRSSGTEKSKSDTSFVQTCHLLYQKLLSLEHEMVVQIKAQPRLVQEVSEPAAYVRYQLLNAEILRESSDPRHAIVGPTLIALQLACAIEAGNLANKLMGTTKHNSLQSNIGMPPSFLTNEFRTELARRILSVAPLLLEKQMGLLGGQGAIFPLSTALRQIGGSPSEKLRCLEFLQQVSRQKGVHFADIIGPLRPDLSSKGNKLQPDSVPVLRPPADSTDAT